MNWAYGGDETKGPAFERTVARNGREAAVKKFQAERPNDFAELDRWYQSLINHAARVAKAQLRLQTNIRHQQKRAPSEETSELIIQQKALEGDHRVRMGDPSPGPDLELRMQQMLKNSLAFPTED